MIQSGSFPSSPELQRLKAASQVSSVRVTEDCPLFSQPGSLRASFLSSGASGWLSGPSPGGRREFQPRSGPPRLVSKSRFQVKNPDSKLCGVLRCVQCSFKTRVCWAGPTAEIRPPLAHQRRLSASLGTMS